MASNSHARHARLGNGGVSRRRHHKRNASGTITLGLLGVAFVVVAAALVVAFRNTSHESTPNTPVSGEAPDFILPSVDGQPVALSSFRGKSNVLLFFNEGYGCAPCWQQALDMQRDAALQAADTVFIPVMVDSASVLRAEIERWGLTVPVLTDTSREVSRSYNALGGMHADKPNHTFVLIDKAGQIRWWQDYPSMRASTDDVVRKVQSVNAAE